MQICLADDGLMATCTLGPADVHVWRLPLTTSEERLAHLGATLDRRERGRAARLRFDRHRQRFIAAHGLVRTVLARYLGTPPSELAFAHTARGKPHLASPRDALSFNVSRSKDIAMLAVTAAAPVGIDVEWIDPRFDFEPLVDFVIPPDEAMLETNRRTAFFAAWTRREALVKASGRGLAAPPTEPRAESAEWCVHTFRPLDGYIATLAVGVEPIDQERIWISG
jgi:4'-phosphopantetheinyl transferase